MAANTPPMRKDHHAILAAATVPPKIIRVHTSVPAITRHSAVPSSLFKLRYPAYGPEAIAQRIAKVVVVVAASMVNAG